MTHLERRIVAAIALEPSPSRAEARQARVRMLAAAACVAVIAWAAAGGARPTGRPTALMLATFCGAAVIAAAALTVALRRGRSMLGRPAPVLIAAAIVTPILLLAWKTQVSAGFAGMSVPWPDRAGFRCLFVGLSTGAAPFAVFLRMWRRTQPLHPRLTGLVLGIAAGAVAWVLVDLWCPVAYVDHLLLGHVLPIALFAASGFALGPLLEARSR